MGLLNRSKNPEQLIEKGDIYREQQEYVKAIECFNEAIKIEPENIFAWTCKVRTYYDQGLSEDVIECCKEIIRINPDECGDAWKDMAESLNVLERFEEAIECCDRVFEVESMGKSLTKKHALLIKSISLMKLNRFEEGLECAKRAEEIGKPVSGSGPV
jgi:tetratricopeptide (TPR) repeat protein